MLTVSNSMTKDIKELIAPCYYDLHRDIREHRHTFYNLPGGRGSGKSSFVSIEIVRGIMRDRTGQSNAIVFRLVAGTMRESVFSQIQWAIDALGVSHLWKSKVSPMQFEYVNGAQIIFRGLDDALKLKSIKPKQGNFSFIWFEEFSELPGELLLRSVQQSVMRGTDDFAVFRSFNPPISLNNWANQYIQIPDDKSITLLTDYTMIPPEWLGASFLAEAERLKEINPMAYRHEYLGEPVGTGGEVFPNIEVRTIPDSEIQVVVDRIYQGIDFGFAVDPAAFIRLYYDPKHEAIYFLDEIYVRGWSNARLAQEIIERKYDDFAITCDCAEPKSIADLKDNGLWYTRACYKRPGCVEYRIKWLQHRKLIIDPKRTPNTYREFTKYSYEIDKNGIVLSQVPDRDNHTIDATAYSLDPVVFRRGHSA